MGKKVDEDELSEFGARLLAGKIVRHWRKRGFDVRCRLEQLTRVVVVSRKTGEEAVVPVNVWCVRSDMVNGLPVRRLPGAPFSPVAENGLLPSACLVEKAS